MPNQTDHVKRRPVDALFGDSSAASSPGYVVEPPQPVTTVSPPPPEQITAPAPPAASPVAAPLPATNRAPTFDPESAVAAAPTAPPDRISQLYDEVEQHAGHSRIVTTECMGLLLKARAAFSQQDFATAEFYTESVEARLQRSAASQQAARRPVVWTIGLWNLAILLAGMLTVAVTYILNLTLFGLAVAPELIVLLRAAAWGSIGGGLGAITSLVSTMRHREYDPASEAGYFARPLVGALLGGILFLLSQAGIVAGNIDIGDVHIGPIFLYVFAALAGFGQDGVIEFLSNLLKTIFRAQKS
jgi:hypothetical protein